MLLPVSHPSHPHTVDKGLFLKTLLPENCPASVLQRPTYAPSVRVILFISSILFSPPCQKQKPFTIIMSFAKWILGIIKNTVVHHPTESIVPHMEASAPGFLPLVQLSVCHTLPPAWLQTLPKVVSSRRKETLWGFYSEE